jgi:hypothetical protein
MRQLYDGRENAACKKVINAAYSEIHGSSKVDIKNGISC